ncbi:MAG: glycosyltransferase family 4 protein, partial [Gaiellales bacterium]
GGRPLVVSLHGSGSAGRFSDLELARRSPRIFRWLVSRARVVIGVSPPLADAAAGAGVRSVLIPHGVELPDEDRVVDHQAQAASGETAVALWAGRLSAEKGVDMLVEAFGKLEGVKLLVAGDGPLRHLLPEASTSEVELLGFVPHAELLTLYERASMLVMPSHSEGFGVVALEAMATGVPVIAARVGGLAWLVVDDVTGIVIEPGDALALRRAVEKLRDDPALRARLGAAGRARAREEFGWDGVTTRTLAAYEQAIR